MRSIGADGEIVREGNEVVVRIPGKSYLLDIEGVTCLNPEAEEPERIYERRFIHKKVFMPDQLAEAQATVVQPDCIVLGMTGYSSIKPEDCAAWGVQPGAYEEACKDLAANVVMGIKREFPDTLLSIVHGASDMGVDRSVIEVGRAFDIPMLGFSCPSFMFYVIDDTDAVYVANSQAEYAEAFIKTLNILIGANGRMQALEHDMVAAIKYNKRLILANVVKSISTNGGPPARNAEGKVMDATAAFQQCIVSLSPRGENSSDPYADLRYEMVDEAIRIARGLLSASKAFSKWKTEKQNV